MIFVGPNLIGSIATLLAAAKEHASRMLYLIHPLKYGVPQGSILDPVLFTICVNNLLSVPTFCKSACYVDDSKLYLSFPSSDMSTAIHNLNADLEQVSRWCYQNSLLINPDKT